MRVFKQNGPMFGHYTFHLSILHSIGLRATASFLSNDPLLNPEQAKFILDATEFYLTHNYFEFDGEFYLQLMSTAKGANVAPSYANLTMGSQIYLAE